MPLFAHKFTFRVTCFDTWSLSNTDNLIRLLRHCWSVQLVSVPWENKTTQYKNLLMVVTPLITSGNVFFCGFCWFLTPSLSNSSHDLTSHLNERWLMEFSFRVQELTLVSPDGDGLCRLSGQWISKRFHNFPFKLRVVFLLLVFIYKSALILQMLTPTGK